MNLLYIHTHDSGRYFSPYGYSVPSDHLLAFDNVYEWLLCQSNLLTKPGKYADWHLSASKRHAGISSARFWLE